MADYDEQRPQTQGSVAAKQAANGSPPASANFTIGAGVPADVASQYRASECCCCCIESQQIY